MSYCSVHVAASSGNRIKSSGVPLIHFLYAQQLRSTVRICLATACILSGGFCTLDLRDNLADAEQEFLQSLRTHYLLKIRSFIHVVSHYGSDSRKALGCGRNDHAWPKC